MTYDGPDRRLRAVPEKNQGLRADDPEDSRIIWMERHFAGVIDGRLVQLKTDLAEAFRTIIQESIGTLALRVTALEEREGRLALLASLVALVVSVVLIVFGKMAGWWL
jgi:hypothetical protein